MSEIQEKIYQDIKGAMKKRDALRADTLRMVKTEIVKWKTSGTDKEIDDSDIIKIIGTMKKQREDSYEQYMKGEREDLAEKEKKEIAILDEYLPKQLDDEELEKIIDEVIAETGASSMKEMGKVMKVAVAKAEGKADGKRINAIVRSRLQK